MHPCINPPDNGNKLRTCRIILKTSGRDYIFQQALRASALHFPLNYTMQGGSLSVLLSEGKELYNLLSFEMRVFRISHGLLFPDLLSASRHFSKSLAVAKASPAAL